MNNQSDNAPVPSRTLSRAEHLLDLATSLTTDSAWTEWQQLPPDMQHYDTPLRRESSARPLAMSARMPALISQPISLDGQKSRKRYSRKTVESVSYPIL